MNLGMKMNQFRNDTFYKRIKNRGTFINHAFGLLTNPLYPSFICIGRMWLRTFWTCLQESIHNYCDRHMETLPCACGYDPSTYLYPWTFYRSSDIYGDDNWRVLEGGVAGRQGWYSLWGTACTRKAFHPYGEACGSLGWPPWQKFYRRSRKCVLIYPPDCVFEQIGHSSSGRFSIWRRVLWLAQKILPSGRWILVLCLVKACWVLNDDGHLSQPNWRTRLEIFKTPGNSMPFVEFGLFSSWSLVFSWVLVDDVHVVPSKLVIGRINCTNFLLDFDDSGNEFI